MCGCQCFVHAAACKAAGQGTSCCTEYVAREENNRTAMRACRSLQLLLGMTEGGMTSRAVQGVCQGADLT
jgi:hypothetical protein